MKRTLPVMLLLPLGILLADNPPASIARDPEVTKENAFTFYRDYRKMTDQPYQVGKKIAELCSDPGGIHAAAEKENGPHWMALIQIYVNDAAGKALDAKSATYPAGSVIVKEKLDEDKHAIALGGMIKRAKGFDPEHGDWEYFYAKKGGAFTTGKMQNCIKCHESGAKAHDYVFGKWLKPEP